MPTLWQVVPTGQLGLATRHHDKHALPRPVSKHPKPAAQSVSSTQGASWRPAPTGPAQSVKMRIVPVLSWKSVQARPGAQPVFGAGVHGREQKRSPGTTPPRPSEIVCTQRAPLAQSASVAQTRAHMLPGLAASLEKFTQPRPAAQSVMPVHPLPSRRVPCTAQTRVSLLG